MTLSLSDLGTEEGEKNQTAEREELKPLEGKGWQWENVILEFEFGVGKNGIERRCKGEGRNGSEEMKSIGRRIWMGMGIALL